VTIQAARRLAWGIGAACLVLVVASLVLLATDWAAITDPSTAQTPWFITAIATGTLGVLISSRLPRNPIGWLLQTIALGSAIYLSADFIAMRGLLSGAGPNSWVEWPAWVFNWSGGLGAFLLYLLILFFPNGGLPGPRWRWAAWLVAGVGAASTVLAMLSPDAVQLSHQSRSRLSPDPNCVDSKLRRQSRLILGASFGHPLRNLTQVGSPKKM
jgi:hypothetical protein